MGMFETWFQPIRATNFKAEYEIYGFPYSGLGASMFAGWRKLIGDQVGVYAAALPGRETRLRESARDELIPLAEVLARVIADRHIATGSKICLVGFSLGGLIAFEVARELTGLGIDIHQFVAGAARAPQFSKPPGFWSRAALHTFPDDKFLLEVDRRYGGVAWKALENEDLRKWVVPTLRADLKMFETYVYQPGTLLSCHLLTLAGTNDKAVPLKNLIGWSKLAKSYDQHEIPGDHFFGKSHAGEVVKEISLRLQAS